MKLVIGFITYNNLTFKYLKEFLSSLSKQSISDSAIFVVDNSDQEYIKNLEYIKKNYPDIEIIRNDRGNIGFSRAYNLMMNRAKELKAEYFLALNPDVLLEDNCIKNLLSEIDKDGTLGSVSPKIKVWDFKNNKKTDVIDSCGIILKPGLRFIDLKQGQKDNIDRNLKILGPSGAFAMYRMDALEKVKQDNGYFDELMFMYKEDCDLAYRLFLAGFSSKCVNSSVVYHDRSVGEGGSSDLSIAKNRKRKNRKVKEWSLLNQFIIFYKYWKIQDLINKVYIVIHSIKIIIFIAIFERYLIKQILGFIKLKKHK